MSTPATNTAPKAACAGRRVHRRASTCRGRKHASARSGRCRAARRAHTDVFPQRASGFWPAGAGSRVCSGSYNNPLNKTDPLGLSPDDGPFMAPNLYLVGYGTPLMVSQVAQGPRAGTAFDQMIARLQRIHDLVHEEAPGWARQELFVAMAAQSLAGLKPHDWLGWRVPQSVTGDGYGAGGFPGEILGRDGWNPEFIDEDNSPARHFIGWFASGYFNSSTYARSALREREWRSSTGTQQDIRSGEAAISIASLLKWNGFTIQNSITMIESVAGGSHDGSAIPREPPGSPACIIFPWC